MPSERGFVVLATVVFTLGLLLGTFVNPLFRIPDERFHADMVDVVQDVGGLLEEGWPLVGERRVQSAVAQASRLHQPRKLRTLAHAVPRDERVSLAELEDLGGVGPDNRMTQHPPLYYMVLASGAGVLDLVDPGDFAYDMELWLLRVLNVLLLAPLPFLAHRTARLLTPHRAVHRAAAILPLGVPGLMLRNGPMLNNDNLFTLLGAVVVYLVVRVVAGDTSRRVAVAAGAACGLAMLTKAFGLLLFGVLGVVYGWAIVEQLRARHPAGASVASGVVAAVVAFVTGGWWYIRNLVVAGTVRPIGFPRPTVEGFEPDWGHWLEQVLQRSWQSFWGGSYVLDAQHGTILGVLMVVTLVATIAAVVRADSGRRTAIMAAILPVVVLAGAIYANQAGNYVDRGRIGGVQGRYFYGGLTGLTSVMAVGLGVVVGRARRWLPLGITVAAGGLYATGFHALLVTEWGAPSVGLADRARALLTWSAPSPVVVVGLGLAFAVCGLWLAGWAARPGAASLGVPAPSVEPDQEVSQQARHDDLQRDDREDDGV